MASNTVEQIFVELLLNAKGYNKDAEQAIKKSDKLEGGLKGVEKQSKSTGKNLETLTGGLGKVVKGIAGLATVIAAGTGLLKLAEEARKANDELNFLSQNLGMSSQNVKAWQGAAAAMGGSAQGMSNDMKNLNSSMNDFKMTGESSMLPMFNTLGVSMVDAQGKIRDTDKVMLDLADSMSRMNREEAVLMGQKLGFDEGTVNTLLQGRDAMKQMVDYHKQMYSSSKEELEASRKLSENQAKLGAHWASMKLMIGNAIVPLLIKMSDIALKFFEFLQRHQKTVKNVFQGLGIFLGMLVVPLLGKALLALTAFIAPFAPFLLVVGALGAAFIALYDDYKTWAEGGNSLFNWGAFSDYINNAKFSTENLGKGFLHLIGDYESWADVAQDGKAWLKLKDFIDDNGVSLKSLANGFRNVAEELVKSTIPTLKGYGEILSKIFSGDFKGAAFQAGQMIRNFADQEIERAKAWGNRLMGSVDVATGQEVGTLAGTSVMNNQGGYAPLLDLIAKGEVGTTGAGGYNTAYRGAKISSQSMFGKNLTQLTFGELKQLQKANIADQAKRGIPASKRSSAMGRYQNIYTTLGDYMKGAGLKDTDLFSPENQDKMAIAMMRKGRFGLDNVKAGKATVGQFQNEVLARQWASIKTTGGRGRYDNDGINMASHGSASQISQAAAIAMGTMPQANIPSGIAKPSNSKTTNVDVNINKVEVKSTASTITGTVNDAMTAAQNSFFQLVGSMN
nr:MAG TPA: tail tape measure [Caudoviricetes sp.]